MKYLFVIFIGILFFASCDKSSTITENASAILYTKTQGAANTLDFDTVFTSVGSVTQQFLIVNPNNNAVRISDIKLSGGVNSFFKMNVNGNQGTDFQNIVLNGGDSLHVFVMVNINPNNASNPFVISDSIGYSWNGNQQFVQLRAYGQNAFFLNTQTISHDTTWTNQLPIVLLGNTTVASGATLSIQQGTKIYCHATTVFEVDGRLIANGGVDTANRILFTGDRLDYPYNQSTNQWRGINFGASSNGNILNNVTVINAYVGIADTMNSSLQSAVRLSLSGCILSNHNYAALYLRNSNASLVNCLITNSNTQTVLENGGNYSFNYCSIAGYSSSYIFHNNPSLIIQNNPESGAASALQATFTNCVVYGDNSQTSEIETDAEGENNFSIDFNYGLYKLDSTLAGVTFSNSIQNTDPQFMTIDAFHNTFNFQLQSTSPAIGAATPNAVTTDILGQLRDAQHPTMGCYEFKN